MPKIDLAYFNFEHGGLLGATSRGDEYGAYDYTGLVRVMGEDDRWPNVIAMGEGDYYDWFGGTGMYGAIEAMRNAGGRPYAPLPCSLPREWGPFAPVIFYDAQTLLVERWWDHRVPGFAERNRNLLRVKPFGGGEAIYLHVTHGDLHEPVYREADAKGRRWLAYDSVLAAVVGDFNAPLSGPDHEPTDLDDPAIYRHPARFAHRLRSERGRPVAPSRLDTSALDYLCGYWDDGLGKRVGGIGMVDVAEAAGITTPTNLPKPSGRQPIAIDHVLANPGLAKRVVPNSVRVHEPIDPDCPDSDHKRVSVTVEL